MSIDKTVEFKYSKKLSLYKVTILCISSLTGAGIYVLVGITTKIAGPAIIIAVFLDLIIALAIAGCYAECVSLYPINGGSFVYVKEAFGEKALFIGWLTWLSNIAYASLLAISVGYFIAAFLNISSYIFIIICSIMPIIIFALFNIRGSKGLTSIQNPLTIALVASLVIGSVYLFFIPKKQVFIPSLPLTIIPLFAASALLFDVFIGFEDICSIAEEVENPKKNIPKAFFISLLVGGIIYELVLFALFFSTNIKLITASDIPILDAVKSNALIYFIVYIGAIFALLTSIGVALMAASRNLYALSRYDFLDRRWSVINKKYESPIKAIWLSSIIAIIILLTGRIELITSISNISYMVTVAFVGLSVIKFRRTKHYEKDNFKIPLYPLSAYICIILPFTLIFFFELQGILIALTWFLIGIMIYLFFSSKRRIFGTIFLISTFFIAIYSIFLGIILIIVGILFYLFSIADRHSIIITLAGVKFFAVIVLGFFIFIVANFSVLHSELFGFEGFFRSVILRLLIYILIFTLITIVFDVIPLREMVYYVVKKVKREKVAIKIGKAQIIELEKHESKKIFIINQIIGIIQIISAIIIILIVLAIAGDLISIKYIMIGGLRFSQEASEFIFVSLMILCGICLSFSAISWLYFNRETRKLGL